METLAASLDQAGLVKQVEAWFRSRGAAGTPLAIETLAGDVSPRRYLRARFAEPGGSTIVAYHPATARDVADRFVITNSILAEAGVRVPAILARDEEAGLLEIEDLGSRTLYDLEATDEARLLPWCEAALDILERLRSIPSGRVQGLNPPLDAVVFRREMEQTRRLLFAPFGLAPDARSGRRLDAALEELAVRLAAQPALVCHRDFMARNLVPLAGGGLAVLDHQDLRLGPAAYDLASWLNDSLFATPERERVSCRRFALLGVPEEEYRRAVVQRGFKVAGTFLAFAERGSRRHLCLVRPSMDRAVDSLAAVPEMGSVAGWIADWWRRCSATLPW